jgi:hypothetical protein
MDCGGGRCIMFTPRGSPFQSGGSVWRFGTTGGLRVCRKCTRHSRYPYLEEEEEEELNRTMSNARVRKRKVQSKANGNVRRQGSLSGVVDFAALGPVLDDEGEGADARVAARVDRQ